MELFSLDAQAQGKRRTPRPVRPPPAPGALRESVEGFGVWGLGFRV